MCLVAAGSAVGGDTLAAGVAPECVHAQSRRPAASLRPRSPQPENTQVGDSRVVVWPRVRALSPPLRGNVCWNQVMRLRPCFRVSCGPWTSPHPPGVHGPRGPVQGPWEALAGPGRMCAPSSAAGRPWEPCARLTEVTICQGGKPSDSFYFKFLKLCLSRFSAAGVSSNPEPWVQGRRLHRQPPCAPSRCL